MSSSAKGAKKETLVSESDPFLKPEAKEPIPI